MCDEVSGLDSFLGDAENGGVSWLHAPDGTRLVVEQALSDLEPVTSGGASGVLEDFRVFGNQKTVQLTSSINTMASVLPELLIATIALQWLGTALLFLILR